MKRFILSLPIDIFKRLRQKAFDRNISMALYVKQAVLLRLEQEKD